MISAWSIVGALLLTAIAIGLALKIGRPAARGPAIGRKRSAGRVPSDQPWMGTAVGLSDLEPDLPEDVMRLHRIAAAAGFRLVEARRYPQFGNNRLEYSSGNVSLEIDFDRNVWSSAFASERERDKDYFDTNIIRDFLLGRQKEVISFPQQVDFIESHLAQILAVLAPDRAQETYKTIDTLRRERAIRLFGLPSDFFNRHAQRDRSP